MLKYQTVIDWCEQVDTSDDLALSEKLVLEEAGEVIHAYFKESELALMGELADLAWVCIRALYKEGKYDEDFADLKSENVTIHKICNWALQGEYEYAVLCIEEFFRSFFKVELLAAINILSASNFSKAFDFVVMAGLEETKYKVINLKNGKVILVNEDGKIVKPHTFVKPNYSTLLV
jgi:phosphoribosyl-ATP pyrophosphohydrolase